MPRKRSPPRLYLDRKRHQWVIRDGTLFVRTGCGERDRAAAEKRLAQYIGHKHKPEPSGAPMIADVLRVYGEQVAPAMKSRRLIAYHMSNILKWWGDKTAAQITMRTCKEYAAARPSQAAAADLKVLKAATDYWHRSEYGPLNFVPVFWKPKPNPPKEDKARGGAFVESRQTISASAADDLAWATYRLEARRDFGFAVGPD